LHLDNDAFPVYGDLSVAAGWLDTHKDALALAFIITEIDDYAARLSKIPESPFPCHYFIGCGAMLNRAAFLELGGYEELLQFYSEEVAVSVHARSRGLVVYQYPPVVVRHNRSPVARVNAQRAFLVTRNELLIAVLYYPFIFALIRVPAFILRQLTGKSHIPVSKPAVIRGVFAAIGLIPKALGMRQALPVEAFKAWKRAASPITIRPVG
jgi:GT2 family glycosyltransferase